MKTCILYKLRKIPCIRVRNAHYNFIAILNRFEIIKMMRFSSFCSLKISNSVFSDLWTFFTCQQKIDFARIQFLRLSNDDIEGHITSDETSIFKIV